MSKHAELIERLRFYARTGTFNFSDCTQAADALEAQEREIEALRKDAERYRWLRDTCWLDTPLEHVICLQLNAKWDRAIDEAIEAAKGEPHGIPPTT